MSESDFSTATGSVWQRKDGRWGVQWSARDPRSGATIKHCTTRATREAAESVLFNRPEARDARMDWSGPVRHRSDWGYDHLMGLNNSKDYCVYFVQAVEGGSIKIGSTKLLRTRMLALQSGCPIQLRVLHVIEGAGYREETALHRRFAKARLHGEWFRPVPELLGLLRDLYEMPDAWVEQAELACGGYYREGKRAREPQGRYQTKMRGRKG